MPRPVIARDWPRAPTRCPFSRAPRLRSRCYPPARSSRPHMPRTRGRSISARWTRPLPQASIAISPAPVLRRWPRRRRRHADAGGAVIMLRESWQRLSAREQRMVAFAAIVVLVAIGWVGLWIPMNADIARLTRDVPRMESSCGRCPRAGRRHRRARASRRPCTSRSAPCRRACARRAQPARRRQRPRHAGRARSLDVRDGAVRRASAAARYAGARRRSSFPPT